MVCPMSGTKFAARFIGGSLDRTTDYMDGARLYRVAVRPPVQVRFAASIFEPGPPIRTETYRRTRTVWRDDGGGVDFMEYTLDDTV